MHIMKSSYTSKIDFGDVIATLVFMINPRRIVEFGILEGFSLSRMIESCSDDCKIDAYDIFDKFNGNSANKAMIESAFSPRATIHEGDYYKQWELFEDGSIDILHIDIANDGDTYETAIDRYMGKMAVGGVMILEGGSEERDKLDWMVKYNKRKIVPVLKGYGGRYKTIESYPSMTIIMKC